MKTKLTLLALLFCCFRLNAQCPSGQIEVSIDIQTDDYGYEGYWQLVPTGNNCGTGTIFSGGNALVGCNGGGLQNQNPGGYGNALVVSEGPWCLNQGSSYDIIYVDDYADGGFTFTVNINGYPVYTGLTGSGDNPGNRFTFLVEPPPARDAACLSIKSPLYAEYGSHLLNAWVGNKGTDTIISVDLNYMVDNGAIQSSSFSGISIAPFDSVLLTHTIPWTINFAGSEMITMWTSNMNGNTDLNASNDSTTKMIESGPSTPNVIDDYIGATPILTVIGNSSNDIDVPRDLDFHPILTRNELWVILKSTENSGGKTVKFSNAGKPAQASLLQQDGNAYHFMSLPTAIAFSGNGNFATSPGVYDANHDGGSPFTGPTLWSSDSTIYAQPSGGNGSHLDMLHQSPYAMGICSEEENSFWVFDDNDQEIVRYDFRKDHGPGNSDHSDAIVRRFSGISIAGDPAREVPSHLVLDKTTGMLYIADTGNDRILKMDINSGTFANNLIPYEAMAEYSYWTNTSWSILADSGLTTPSGIDLIDERLIVSDYATGDIIIYDISGSTSIELGRVVTGTPGIMGIKIGPDGKIWYVNAMTNEVIRIDGLTTGVKEIATSGFSVFPNPAVSKLTLNMRTELNEDAQVKFFDSKGSLINTSELKKGNKEFTFDVSGFAGGIYSVSVLNSTVNSVMKFVKK